VQSGSDLARGMGATQTAGGRGLGLRRRKALAGHHVNPRGNRMLTKLKLAAVLMLMLVATSAFAVQRVVLVEYFTNCG